MYRCLLFAHSSNVEKREKRAQNTHTYQCFRTADYESFRMNTQHPFQRTQTFLLLITKTRILMF